MREMNITATVGTLTGRVVASTEASVADRKLAALAAAFTAPKKRGRAKPPALAARGEKPRPLNPMPWCKHPAASDFGRLCTDQLKVYKVKTTGG
jgi:hypothetical protein